MDIGVARIQNTWSPSTFAPKRPSIKELKKLYFNLVDKKPKTQRELFTSKYSYLESRPSTSFQTSSYLSVEERNLPSIPEIITSSESTGHLKVPRKFVVTPAYLDDGNSYKEGGCQ